MGIRNTNLAHGDVLQERERNSRSWARVSSRNSSRSSSGVHDATCAARYVCVCICMWKQNEIAHCGC